jgi:hypothetical protein
MNETRARVAVAIALLAWIVAALWPATRVEAHASVEQLVAPLTVGSVVAGGFRLGPFRRGEEHDVVVVGTRANPPAAVEVHVLDAGRWPEAMKVGAYGVAYEEPHSPATDAERLRVRDAIADAMRAHPDVTAPVDALMLGVQGARPRIHDVLARFAGTRGLLVALSVCALFVVVAPLRGSAFAVASLLLVAGVLLRFTALDLPFERDQDVQRAFTGHMPLWRVLFVEGLADRHPPLWFVVLHASQALFGQSEAALRAPAALCGALVGPAITLVLARRGGVIGPVAAASALAVTVSGELISQSREVSDIPLMSLLAVLMVASATRLATRPSPATMVLCVAAHVLGLYTYYLAPLVVAGEALALGAACFRPEMKRAAAWIGGLSAPAMFLLVRVAIVDSSARATAHARPDLAWGERTVMSTAHDIARLTWGTFPATLLVLALLAVACARLSRVATSGALFALAGFAAVAPVARVQPYYQAAVAPLLALAAGAMSLPAWRPAPIVRPSTIRRALGSRLLAAALCVAVGVPPLLALDRLTTVYVPTDRANVSAWAKLVAARPERRLVFSVEHDSTLMTYALGRELGVETDWRTLERTPNDLRSNVLGWTFVALLSAHRLPPDPKATARARLLAEIEGGALFLARDPWAEGTTEVLTERCEQLQEVSNARLYACK